MSRKYRNIVRMSSVEYKDKRAEYGNTLIIDAVQHNNFEEVKSLIRHGVDVNVKTNTGWAALLLAAYKGNLDIVKALLAVPHININIQHSKNGYTALMIASEKNHPDIVKALLNAPDINVNVQNNDGWTALLIAVHQRHLDIIKILLKDTRVNVTLQNKAGQSIVNLASGDEIRNITTKALFSPASMETQFPLLYAIARGNLTEVRRLLALPETDVNKTLADGITGLMIATDQGNISIIQELLKSPNIQVFKKAEPSAGRLAGMSALMFSVMVKNITIFKALLDYYNEKNPRAILFEKRIDNHTVLSLAVEYEQVEMVKLILDMDLPKNGMIQLIDSVSPTIYNKNPEIKQVLDDKKKELTAPSASALQSTRKRPRSPIERNARQTRTLLKPSSVNLNLLPEPKRIRKAPSAVAVPRSAVHPWRPVPLGENYQANIPNLLSNTEKAANKARALQNTRMTLNELLLTANNPNISTNKLKTTENKPNSEQFNKYTGKKTFNTLRNVLESRKKNVTRNEMMKYSASNKVAARRKPRRSYKY